MNALPSSLANGFSGELVTPADPAYDSLRSVWNAMIDRRPALIARCRTTADVVAAVTAARSEGLELAVRCGGHSVAGHSVCDDGLVVDLGAMRGAEIDADAMRATVQGGALLGDLDGAAQQAGLATPAGVVSHTGVGGLTLGGGIGWLSRLYGLTCDNLVEAEVVTAGGEVVVASDEEDSELLWALRGGGGNFGVVTRFDFRLHPLGAPLWTATFAFAAERGEAALAALADVAAGAPRELTVAASIGAARASPFVPEEWHGRPVLTVFAVFTGAADEGARLVGPLRGAGPVAEAAEEKSYLDIQRTADDAAAHGRRRYWKGHFLTALDQDGLRTFLEAGARAAEESPYTGCELFALGGAVADVGSGETAFAHREAEWDFIASAAWPEADDDERIVGIARRTGRAVEPYARGVYANDLGDEGTDRVRAAYGAENYERLVRVKDRLDPENVFHRNQNVQPSA